MSDWLDLELAHRLAPVKAPEELWERIESARRSGEVLSRRAWRGGSWGWLRASWPAAALASLALAATALWLANTRDPALDLRQLALASTQGQLGPAGSNLQSSDPAKIRIWLQRQAGVDVPLRTTAGVRLEGARVLRGAGRRVGAIEYRVGQDSMLLLVAHADPACPLPPRSGRIAMWQARDQVYALACSNPERTQAGCLLCHAL